jgi:hypothetical protein
MSLNLWEDWQPDASLACPPDRVQIRKGLSSSSHLSEDSPSVFLSSMSLTLYAFRAQKRVLAVMVHPKTVIASSHVDNNLRAKNARLQVGFINKLRSNR